MNRVTHSQYFSPLPQQKFFFDTNIWLYLLHPKADVSKGGSKVYSELFESILIQGSRILTSITVISEYTNRLIADYKDMYCEERGIHLSNKEYRATKDYLYNVQFVRQNIDTILNLSEMADQPIDKEHIAQLLDFKNRSGLDVNDYVIEALAEQEDAYLVTHDYDYLGSKCLIVTANRRYFQNN